MSRRIESTGVYLRYTSGSYDFSWHNAPQRQIIVCLNGSTSVTTGDGSERVFGAGDCVLAEDCGGRGHESKSADGAGRWSLFITLPDEERGDDERGDDAAVAPGPRRGDVAARAFALGALVGVVRRHKQLLVGIEQWVFRSQLRRLALEADRLDEVGAAVAVRVEDGLRPRAASRRSAVDGVKRHAKAFAGC